jgi:hypothetical protein
MLVNSDHGMSNQSGELDLRYWTVPLLFSVYIPAPGDEKFQQCDFIARHSFLIAALAADYYPFGALDA